ncbi:MAG: sugar phosphate isomerase/epimerase family protein [Gemmataceae bacterium]
MSDSLQSPISRRSFLASSAALLALAQVRPAAARENPFGTFTVGVQTYTFRKFGLEQALKRISELGVKFVELTQVHLATNSSDTKITDAKKLAGDYGITPIAFGVQGFSNNHDANKKMFEFAAKLGVKHLSADPNPDSFDSLDKLVEEYKISIAIHPHGPAGGGKLHRWYSAEVIMKAVKDHHALIGTCLDTGHLIRSAQLGEKLDPAQQVRVMGARNFGLHLKDHDNKRHTDVPFGDKTGVLDVLSVLKALQEVKFGGYISIEYEANADNPSPDVKLCLEYFAKQVKALG